uniref:Seminal plasma sperm motility inhibitor/spermadhesin AQN-3-like protein n=1 Tax=Sus scrofa TaxID=9823 RepID=A0A4X1SFT7_PIG
MKLGSAIPWALLLSTATLVSTAQNKGSDDCGGFLKNYSGWISYYKALMTNCVWTIEMKPGHKIILQILPLNLTCGKEYLEVRDQRAGPDNFLKVCGGTTFVYQSSSNVATVKYSRDSHHPASSFNVYFYGIPQGAKA